MTTPKGPPGAGLTPPGGGLWPAHIPRPHAAAPPPRTGPASAPASAATAAPTVPVGARVLVESFSERLPWRDVKWTVPFVGFLGYLFAITTYRLPIGNPSAIIGLIGLLMQREKLRVPGLLKGLGVFLLWCILGYAFSEYGQVVKDRLELAIKVWLVALVAVNALRTRPQIRFAIFFWLACFALYPVRGALFNYYIYGESMVGRAAWNFIFSNPNDLAAYAVLQLSLALGFLALERKGPSRLATICGLAVVPFLILLTKSRGGFLGLAVFVLVALVAQRKRGRGLVIFAVISALVVGLAPDDALGRVRGLKGAESGNLKEVDPEGSAYQRYEIWKVARTIIRENPVLGVGLGAYPQKHRMVAARPVFDPTARGFRDTHSTYLNVAAETGLVGAVVFFLSYLLALIQIDRVRRRAKTMMPATSQQLFIYLAGTLGFFVCAVFGSMAHVSFLIIHVSIMWAIAELLREEMAAVKKGTLVVAAPEPVTSRRRLAR